MNSFESLETLWRDVRFGVRVLGRSSGVTAVIIVTFMLGIGVNAALFSIVYAVLLKPLSYRNPDRLVYIAETPTKIGGAFDDVGSADFEDWLHQARSFDSMAGFYVDDVSLTMNGDTSEIRMVSTLGSITRVLGVSPALGRDFLPEEVRPRSGGDRRSVALIGDRFFRQRFGGDPAALGKIFTVNKIPYLIVGVLPPGLRMTLPGVGADKDPEAIVNIDYDVAMFRRFGRPRSGPRLQVVGRLKPGVKLETARAELEIIRAAIGRQYPRTFESKLVMMPLLNRVTGNRRLPILVLWGAVGFVLLVACVNVTNLLLARAAVRTRETAVRAALGAGRMRLMRQFLTESLLLAFAGGMAGIALASWAVRLIVNWSPIDIPRLKEASMDWNVLLFSLVVCTIAGMLCGTVPALENFRYHPGEMLKGGKGALGSKRRHRLHGLLVVSELAFSLVLLTGAGLMLKGLWVIRSRTAIFAPDRVLTTFLNVRDVPGMADNDQYLGGLATRMEAIPGVRAAAVINYASQPLRIFGLPELPRDREILLTIARVTPHYPAAAGVRLLAGRWLRDDDREGTPNVMVVNDAFVKWYRAAYPGSGPIVGRQIVDAQTPSFRIAGVVSDDWSNGFGGHPDADAAPEAFVTHWQWSFNGFGTILMRTSADPMALAGSLRSMLNRTPRIGMTPIETVDDQLSAAIAPRRFQATLLFTFAALALLLAMVGTYGVLFYTITERTQEIGVRMALGATEGDILRTIMGWTMKLVGVGVLGGLLASFGLTHFMTSMLYGVEATDPWTYSAVSLLLAATSIFTAWIPVSRACRVAPIIALRYE